MADNNTISITSAGVMVQGAVNVTDPTNGNYAVPINFSNLGLTYGSGGGAGQVNVSTVGQLLLAPNSNCTINLNTGALAGSVTATINGNTQTSLVEPDGTVFVTTAAKTIVIGLQPTPNPTSGAVGSASLNLFPGPVNGWSSMLGNSTIPVRGGLYGGPFSNMCSDSIGWPVSASLANLVVNNADPVNPATIQFVFQGN